jgi:hypothetical protein
MEGAGLMSDPLRAALERLTLVWDEQAIWNIGTEADPIEAFDSVDDYNRLDIAMEMARNALAAATSQVPAGAKTPASNDAGASGPGLDLGQQVAIRSHLPKDIAERADAIEWAGSHEPETPALDVEQAVEDAMEPDWRGAQDVLRRTDMPFVTKLDKPWADRDQAERWEAIAFEFYNRLLPSTERLGRFAAAYATSQEASRDE